MSGLERYAELEKYIFDPFYGDRYFEAASSGAIELVREQYKPGIKSVADREIIVSDLDFFKNNKKDLENDYIERLTEGIDGEKIKKFVNIMNEKWVDGYRSRNDSYEIWEVKNSIRNYLISKSSSSRKFTLKDDTKAVRPLFTPDEMSYILYVTQRMFDHYLQEYLAQRDDHLENSTNNIYVHRGMNLEELIPEGEYLEHGYITSYSLSHSAPEQFSAIESKGLKARAMIGSPVYDFYERILLFAPFFPGITTGQMELCIIPSVNPMYIRYNGVYSDIHEYTLSITSLSLAEQIDAAMQQDGHM